MSGLERDDIIRMAREAGAARLHNYGNIIFGADALERFAALVAAEYERQRKAAGRYEDGYRAGAAAEREACAKLIEPTEEHRRDASWGFIGGDEGVALLVGAAAAIRARGQQDNG